MEVMYCLWVRFHFKIWEKVAGPLTMAQCEHRKKAYKFPAGDKDRLAMIYPAGQGPLLEAK